MMASVTPGRATALAVLLSFSLLLHRSLGSPVVCEELPRDLCAFAVSTASRRCVLESSPRAGGGATEYQCRTSAAAAAAQLSDWIETDECVRECGVDRGAVGISSDALLEPRFTAKLCSPACYHGCPNILDLYFNLAAGEGVYLPELCAARRSGRRRSTAELLSSGAAAGPVGSVSLGDSPAAAPPVAPPPASA